MNTVSMVEPIRVLIADDNPRFRRGLRALLQTAPETEVAGEAATGEEAVVLTDRLQPDVILMDIKMPDGNGIEATRRIMETSPHIGILMLTMVEDDDSVFAAMRAGARGYLLKGALKAEILRAIRGVSSGEAIFGPAIARRLIDYFAAPRSTSLGPVFPELTAREREILDLIAQHLTNPQIAARLSLSPKTIRNIASSIFNKLQVSDRAEAIMRARDAGLGRNDP
jgi:DNA-binding NarL/FixJ family response regulator